jgi:hypothetical protein
MMGQRVRVAAFSAALPALLLFGSATAQAELPGPTSEIQPWFGGLTVTVHDNSGIGSWCTYVADWYRSLPFYLPANGVHEFVITPSFPQNQAWNVAITCDNGTRSDATVFY